MKNILVQRDEQQYRLISAQPLPNLRLIEGERIQGLHLAEIDGRYHYTVTIAQLATHFGQLESETSGIGYDDPTTGKLTRLSMENVTLMDGDLTMTAAGRTYVLYISLHQNLRFGCDFHDPSARVFAPKAELLSSETMHGGLRWQVRMESTYLPLNQVQFNLRMNGKRQPDQYPGTITHIEKVGVDHYVQLVDVALPPELFSRLAKDPRTRKAHQTDWRLEYTIGVAAYPVSDYREMLDASPTFYQKSQIMHVELAGQTPNADESLVVMVKGRVGKRLMLTAMYLSVEAVVELVNPTKVAKPHYLLVADTQTGYPELLALAKAFNATRQQATVVVDPSFAAKVLPTAPKWVVAYNSAGHLRAFYASRVIVYTEKKELATPLKTAPFQALAATKAGHLIRQRKFLTEAQTLQVPESDADHVYVASAAEQQYVREALGWPEEQVHLVGVLHPETLTAPADVVTPRQVHDLRGKTCLDVTLTQYDPAADVVLVDQLALATQATRLRYPVIYQAPVKTSAELNRYYWLSGPVVPDEASLPPLEAAIHNGALDFAPYLQPTYANVNAFDDQRGIELVMRALAE